MGTQSRPVAARVAKALVQEPHVATNELPGQMHALSQLIFLALILEKVLHTHIGSSTHPHPNPKPSWRQATPCNGILIPPPTATSTQSRIFPSKQARPKGKGQALPMSREPMKHQKRHHERTADSLGHLQVLQRLWCFPKNISTNHHQVQWNIGLGTDM